MESYAPQKSLSEWSEGDFSYRGAQIMSLSCIRAPRISRTLLNEALTGSLTDRQVRILISKMESLGLIQREGEKRGVRYLQTARFERMFCCPNCPKPAES